MADVTVKYKGNTIAEMSAEGTKTLNTSGKYCEGDIEVSYIPPESNGDETETETVNCKIYNITLAKKSGWVELVTLDADVLAHINDENFSVTLICTSTFEGVGYAMSFASATNKQVGIAGSYPTYGIGIRQTGATTINYQYIYYKPNNTGTSTSLGGFVFRVTSGKYYIYPHDGYVRAGDYRLIFAW